MNNPNIVQAANAYIVSESKQTGESIRKVITKSTQPFVTISRETGAGGTTVGNLLVNYLNERDKNNYFKWKLFDRNIIGRVLEDHRLPELYKDFLNETKISEIQDTFERLMGLHPGMNQLAKKTCQTILNLASLGNVVIIGRGANIITKNLEGGFHVRLIADYDWKVKHVESLYGLSRKDAIKYVNEEDVKRKEYVKKIFNRNVGDPMIYDLIIRTGRVTFEEAAEIIAERVLRYEHSRNLQVAESH